MLKITNKLIADYIYGNDIEGVSLEELEDNKLFMEKVIDFTNDKNMYNLCSNKVKTDSGFMRFLIKKFNKDLDFLCNVTEYYFTNSNDFENKDEIAFFMKLLTKKYDDPRYEKYKMLLNVFYSSLRLEVEIVKENEKEDKEFLYDTGLGFYYIYELHKSNELLLNYYAKKMLKELFIDDYYGLSRVLHEKYTSVSQIEEKGLINCLLQSIRLYDVFLFDYVCVHKDVLSIILNKYKNVLKNWDNYYDENEANKFFEIEEKVCEYISKNESKSILSATEQLCYSSYKLGLTDKFDQYGIICKDDFDLMDEDYEYFESVINESFQDRVNYNEVKKIIKSILFEHKMPEELEKFNDCECKIIAMKSFKKKKTRQKH